MDDDDAKWVEQLLEIPGVTEQKAAGFAEEYPDLLTFSWAVRNDEDYLWDEFQIKGDYLYSEMLDRNLWEPYWQCRDELRIPDRRQDYVEKYLQGWEQRRLKDYTE